MDYDNGMQDTSNYGDTYESNSYSHDTRQDNYEPQHHHSFTNENDSSKLPEPSGPKHVEFQVPDSVEQTSDLIDIKDSEPAEPQETTPQLEKGNYENSIIDHFDSAFVNLRKDNYSTNDTQNVTKNGNGMTNQNFSAEKEDTDCCGCSGGSLMCLAIFCDWFGP